MLYARSREIEQRLAELLSLIRRRKGSAEQLAATLGVSTATIARGIAALRYRGHRIEAERFGAHWRYRVGPKKENESQNAVT